MAKGDYKNSDVKSRYRNLAKARTDLKEASEKIVVSNDDKRTRAELLDIVEELRAVLYMIINSLGNSSDDDPGITTAQSSAITANTAKVSQGFSTSGKTLSMEATTERGRDILRFTVTNTSDGTTTSGDIFIT